MYRFKGGEKGWRRRIDPDLAATVAGAVAGVCQVLIAVGVDIPEDATQVIGGLALIVLGWLTNKRRRLRTMDRGGAQRPTF